MSDHAIAVPVATENQSPRFLDTYALAYAFILVFLIPGLAIMSTLPFRDYTFTYVSVFAMPFLLGLLATIFTDSADSPRTLALRSAILIPLIVVTGVTVLFTGSLTVLPISALIRPGNDGWTTPAAVALLAMLAAPLVLALLGRVRRRLTWRSAVQICALVIALAIACSVGYLMLQGNNELRSFARKDLTIYVTGAVMWYLPSFGIAAGAWRSIGLV